MQLEVFHFEKDKKNFDDYARENGDRYWYARDLMQMLGYEDFKSFRGAIQKAMIACESLNIQIMDNISPVYREIDGKTESDFKLSRFGCYMTAMNGDVKKPQVAAAQAYFVTIAESLRKYIEEATNVERVLIREDITDREKSLSSKVNKLGIENFSFFQNAGYRGMYNMNLSKLKEYRGIPHNRSALDFMGREELAANLFRITQTEAKIINEQLYGQRSLENAAESVGKKVRQTMKEISGNTPESLSSAEDIKEVKKGLKQTHKKFQLMDGKKKKKK